MKRIIFIVGILLMSVAQSATVFNLFQPATGILVGSSTTYITSAAAWGNVSALLTGSCTSSTFVLGGGSCATLTVSDSITGAGVSGTPLLLSGDSASPGNSQYYGTNSSGTKGFFSLPSSSVTLAATQIGYGNASNILTGTADFIWTDSTQTLTFGTSTIAPIITTVAGATSGDNITIIGGPAASISGGSVILKGGTSLAGGGGGVQLLGSNGVGVSQGGGIITLTGGSASTNGIGGAVNITGGNSPGGSGGQPAGPVVISGGQATAGSSGTLGGLVTIQGGTSTSGIGGSIAFNTAAGATLTNAMGIGPTGAITMPELASSSVATTGTVCWTTSTGNLTVDTTAACLTSTKRVKKNISPLYDELTDVMKLRPVSYDLKTDPDHVGRQIGLIAEEVQAIDPRLVALDSNGDPKGVRYMQMTAVLIKAIQQQQHEIDSLKKQLHH